MLTDMRWGIVSASISLRSTTMSTDTRIESLETQVRTLKRMLFGVFGVVIVGGLLAATTLQSVPDVIRAKKFEVVNDEGKVIVLMNSVLHQGTHYGFVATANSKGQTLVALGVSTDGEGVVRTENGKGGLLVKLGTTTSGNGVVKTENGKGGTLVTLGTYSGTKGGYVETFTQTGLSTSEIP
jgi:hypothetical protein